MPGSPPILLWQWWRRLPVDISIQKQPCFRRPVLVIGDYNGAPHFSCKITYEIRFGLAFCAFTPVIQGKEVYVHVRNTSIGLTVPNTSLAVTFSLTIVVVIYIPVAEPTLPWYMGHIDLPLTRRLPSP